MKREEKGFILECKDGGELHFYNKENREVQDVAISKRYNCLSMPIQVSFGITNRCNLNCKHCAFNNRDSSNELTTDEVKQIILNLAKEKLFGVIFTGGEPFA